jgi:hypothetical protein
LKYRLFKGSDTQLLNGGYIYLARVIAVQQGFCVVQQIDLIVNGHDLVRVDFQLLQHLFDFAFLAEPVGIGQVDDMQDQVGVMHFLQGSLEGGEQLLGHAADEAHRVGQDEIVTGVNVEQVDPTQQRVQGGEQFF